MPLADFSAGIKSDTLRASCGRVGILLGGSYRVEYGVRLKAMSSSITGVNTASGGLLVHM